MSFTNETQIGIRALATDTLGTIAVAVERETFQVFSKISE